MTPMESVPSRGFVDLDRLAEEFLERYRRGERPRLEEYTAAYPELADDIRDLFPGLVELERVKASACGPLDQGASLGPPLTRLGDYLIVGIIGQGAMGIVYEAVRESLRSRVALKIMHPRYRDHDRYLRRFHVEAKAAARLHHTNIVSVFDYGEADGFVYYAMPLIVGHSLETVLDDVRRLRVEEVRDYAHTRRDGPVPPGDTAQGLSQSGQIAHRLLSGNLESADAPTERPHARAVAGTRADVAGETAVREASLSAGGGRDDSRAPAPDPPSSLAEQSDDRYYREIARLGAQAADALAYAHKRGVLHRDIKPSNLLLDALGNIWVTDFGLAKLEDGDDLSRSTDVVGTMRYMSPERFGGVSSRSVDIYALGATLYEMLTLQPVFDERDPIEFVARITHEPPVALREHDRRIPRDLETIILKALAKDPKDRFANADDMAAELQRFVENRPIRSRAVPGYERFWRWCKRNPGLASVNALAAALIAAIAVIASVSAVVLKDQRDAAQRNLVRAYTSEISAHSNAAEGRRLSRRAGQRFEALEEIAAAVNIAPAAGGLHEAQRLRLRNQAIAAMSLPDFRVDREIELSWARIRGGGTTFDAGLSRFAATLADGSVSVRRVADGREQWRLPGIASNDQTRTSCFSADGRYLAMSARERTVAQVWDLSAGRLVVSDPELCWSNVRAWDFHPGGRELAVGHSDGSIHFYALPSGALLRRWGPRSSGVGTIAFSPDGSKLAFGSGGLNKVLVCETDSGRLLTELSHQGGCFHLAWNPRKPNVLAAGCQDSVIYVWNVATRECTAVLQGGLGDGLVVAFHPSGELLASRGWDSVLRVWDTRTGQQVMTRQSFWGPELFFSADGRRLAPEIARTTARVIEFAQGDCRRYAAQPFAVPEAYGGVAIDHAGRYLAASAPGRVCLWQLETGAYLGAVPTGNEHVKSLAFDSSGALVVSGPRIVRWPVRSGVDEPGRIGPPELLAPYRTSDAFSISRDGSVIGVPNYEDGAVVFDAAGSARPRYLFPHLDVRGVNISPDGHRAVTNTHSILDGLRLWDTQTGRLIHDFPDLPRHVCRLGIFSPDGRWLVAAGDDGLVLVDAATGKPRVSNLDGPFGAVQFAPDSRTLAVVSEVGSVALLDMTDGHELARFEDPEQARANVLAFSRDGRYLAVAIQGRGPVRAWDLHAIRRRLAGLGLDWQPAAAVDSGPFEHDSVERGTAQPFRVDRGAIDEWLSDAGSLEKVLPAGFRAELNSRPDSPAARHHRAHLLALLGRHAEAVRDFSSALAKNEGNIHLREARFHSRIAAGAYADALTDADELLRRTEGNSHIRFRIAQSLNDAAWSLSKAPHERGGAGQAVAMARRASSLSQNNDTYRHTLGVSLYRAGDLAEAVTVLESTLGRGEGEYDGFDLLFLAMAHQRMGRTAEARKEFDRALRWRRERAHMPEGFRTEYDKFQAEAQSVLEQTPRDSPEAAGPAGTSAR